MLFTSYLPSVLLFGAGLVAAQNEPKGWLGPAKVTVNNLIGYKYSAEFEHPMVRGSVLMQSFTGTGVNINVDLAGLRRSGFPGAWTYTIHEEPITDFNCNTAKGPLDPYRRGTATPCDPKRPENCVVGDLSGKHGKIMVDRFDRFQSQYTDLYLGLRVGPAAYAGNRSVVIHANDANKTPVACANFVMISMPGMA
ncbi:superoxide dismutase [Geopyxis carbonaria]|nr:superoxide dismutase [Geopyxis carbonaria]